MRTLRLVLFALVTLAWAVPPQALQGQGATLAFRYVVTVRPGQEPAFEAAWKEHIAHREANDDPWAWNVFQQQFGDSPGSYVIRSDGHSWADLDAYASFAAEMQDYITARIAPLVESLTSGVVENDTALSVPVDDVNAMNVFAVQNISVDPAGQAAFDAGMLAFREAVLATGYDFRYGVQRRILGGAGNVVMVVGQAANYAGLERPDETIPQMLARHYGAQRSQEMFAPFLETFESVSTNIVIRRADLSSPLD